jgi:hypothetical protein
MVSFIGQVGKAGVVREQQIDSGTDSAGPGGDARLPRFRWESSALLPG